MTAKQNDYELGFRVRKALETAQDQGLILEFACWPRGSATVWQASKRGPGIYLDEPSEVLDFLAGLRP